jgi:hypothetical protein
MLARWSGWIVGLAAALASALIFHAARGTSFFLDEWWFITDRRDASLEDFMRPHFGHLIAIPVAVYKALFVTFGLETYAPYLVVLVGLHVLTCLLLFVYLRRRGQVIYAVAATVAMLFLGHAWEDIIWPFQITYLLSTTSGIATLLLLDRRNRLADVGAAVAIAISIAAGGVGLAFAAGALVELLWTRRDWRRLWIVVAPLAVYGLWYVEYATPQGGLDNLSRIDPFTTRLAGEASRALLGTPLGLGQVVVALIIVTVSVQIVRAWPIPGRFANCVVMLVGYWALLTYARGGDQFFSRYTYLSALFLTLVVGELVATWQPFPVPTRALALVGAIALVLLLGNSIVSNGRALADGGSGRRRAAVDQRAAFSALQLGSQHVDRDVPIWWIYPDSPRSGGVIDAIGDLDFPVLSRAELYGQPEHARRAADAQLFEALGGFDARPRSLASDPPLGAAAVKGTVTTDGPCVTFGPEASGVDVTLSGDEIAVRIEPLGSASIDGAVRSIAEGFRDLPSFTIASTGSRDVVLPTNSLRPWVVRLTSDDAFRACSVLP